MADQDDVPLQQAEPPPAIDPLRIATYAQVYATASNDPFRRSYASLMQRFDPLSNVAPLVLLDQATGDPHIPQVYLMVTTGSIVEKRLYYFVMPK